MVPGMIFTSSEIGRGPASNPTIVAAGQSWRAGLRFVLDPTSQQCDLAAEPRGRIRPLDPVAAVQCASTTSLHTYKAARWHEGPSQRRQLVVVRGLKRVQIPTWITGLLTTRYPQILIKRLISNLISLKLWKVVMNCLCTSLFAPPFSTRPPLAGFRLSSLIHKLTKRAPIGVSSSFLRSWLRTTSSAIQKRQHASWIALTYENAQYKPEPNENSQSLYFPIFFYMRGRISNQRQESSSRLFQLQAMYFKTDRCPIEATADMHFCAAQGRDHTEVRSQITRFSTAIILCIFDSSVDFQYVLTSWKHDSALMTQLRKKSKIWERLESWKEDKKIDFDCSL